MIAQIRETAFGFGGLCRSAFGKALSDLLKHWDGLTLFLNDPRIPLDNNAAEKVLRGPVVGHKNFYDNRSRLRREDHGDPLLADRDRQALRPESS